MKHVGTLEDNELEDLLNKIVGGFDGFENSLEDVRSERGHYIDGMAGECSHLNDLDVNIIPGNNKAIGKCAPKLVVFCTAKSFKKNILKMVYHLGIQCPGKTVKALIITSYWDNDEYVNHMQALETLRNKYSIIVSKALFAGNNIEKSRLV